jgi:predicted MPP superfamily phosphohydrolase
VSQGLSRRAFLTLGGLAGMAGAVGAYSSLVERYAVQTNTYRIRVPNLPPVFTGFRIVHLTDIHHGALMSKAWIKLLVARANRIPRDITVCTGDFVHARNTPEEVDGVWPILNGLHAPGGVYSVLGNHDHWADTQRSRDYLRRSGQDATRKRIAIERFGGRLWLAGAGDLWEDHFNLDYVLDGIPQKECRIVLAHNPDTADTGYASRVDLLLAGHTHGGQVSLPLVGPPVLPVRNKTYSSGFKRSLRGEGVFISRGIGWAVYPVRFNCYPEIAVLELEPA